jgi:hypothetical protein
MRIAFDLDGTLIPASGSPMQIERLGLFSRAISREPVRAGTPNLLSELRRRGHEVWIYTTSFRRPMRLQIWFASFGVRLDGIVNQARHLEISADRGIPCSKYPPAFGIDLLIDDSVGVEMEGRRFGFSVLQIKEDNASWCALVNSAVFRFESRTTLPRPVQI